MLEPLEVEQERLQPAYVSKEGWDTLPILRGYTEIQNVHRTAMKHDGFICGGYVRWMCSTNEVPIPAGDVDIYFPDEKDFEAAHFDFRINGCTVKHENEVSVTYHKVKEGYYLGAPDIQLIKPLAEGRMVTNGDMSNVLNNFDFTVVRAGLINRMTAMVDADFAHDEAGRILRLKNIHCPVGSTMRCMKYSKKGYWLPPTQALELFFDWDSRTDEYKNELIRFVTMANEGKGLTEEEINTMEKMMRVD